MSEEKELPDLASYMTAQPTGPRADRRQINIALVDDEVNTHPNQNVCREGQIVSLIDWLNHEFEVNEKSELSDEDQRAAHWERRAASMTGVVTEDTTFFIKLDEARERMFKQLIDTGAELEAICRLADITISQLEIPSLLRFIPWATYVRVGKTSKFITHKTMDTREL